MRRVVLDRYGGVDHGPHRGRGALAHALHRGNCARHPVERRAVDRRFNRARYDAVRTIETFSQRLRGEIGLETLAAELTAVTATTLGPRCATVHLTGGQRL